jgi:hypothetical protein
MQLVNKAPPSSQLMGIFTSCSLTRCTFSTAFVGDSFFFAFTFIQVKLPNLCLTENAEISVSFAQVLGKSTCVTISCIGIGIGIGCFNINIAIALLMIFQQ